MTKTLNYIWRAWFILLAFTLMLICAIPVYLLSIRKKDYPFAYWWIRMFCILLFYGMGFRYSFENLSGKKIEKNKQYVIIANHTSIMDIMLTVVLFPNHPLCFVGKKELEKIPLFGTIYRRICVLVDRSSPRSRARVYQLCSERMQNGQNIVIFPEGGVSDDPSVILDEFKDGPFLLANKHKHPLIVQTYVGLKEKFPFDNSKGKPGKIKVFLNDILEPNGNNHQELKKIAFSEIKSTLIINNSKK
jgi:1-acyl-sn-glycerol-3-phosphate acyltransferase